MQSLVDITALPIRYLPDLPQWIPDVSNLNRTLHLRPATIDDIVLLRRRDDEPAVANSDPNDD